MNFPNWQTVELKRPPLKTCVLAFIDLLGYGGMLRAASAQLSHPIGALAVERIRRFQKMGRTTPRPTGVKVRVLNDALVATLDLPSEGDRIVRLTADNLNPVTLSADGAAQAWEFIVWVRDLHDEIRSDQRASGYSGARTVIALDERLDDSEEEDELNLNMAFALAYEADRAGSREGFIQDFMYVQWFPFSLIVAQCGRQLPEKPDIVSTTALGRAVSFLRCVPGGKPGAQVLENGIDFKTAETYIAGEKK